MFLKKSYLIIGLCGLTGFGLTNAYADTTAMAPTSWQYVYVGGELGWAHSDWSDFTNSTADNGGVVYGGKLGYQATRRFGAEVGGFVLPKSTIDFDLFSASGTIKSWAAYAAATFRFPLLKNERLYLRGKVGPVYRSLDHSDALGSLGTGHYWTAILGASLNYAFGNDSAHPIILGFEYSNIFGSRDSWSSNGNINANAAPSAQIYAATLSFAFRV